MIQDNAVAPIVKSGADPDSTLREVSQRVRELLGK
jgi:hypothetical protein